MKFDYYNPPKISDLPIDEQFSILRKYYPIGMKLIASYHNDICFYVVDYKIVPEKYYPFVNLIVRYDNTTRKDSFHISSVVPDISYFRHIKLEELL